MQVLVISLVLLVLSLVFVVLMDLLVGLPLSVSFNNITSPFLFMKMDEMIILVLVILYVIAKPIIQNYLSKR
ncbi:hypothetical protein J7E78_16910 [Paenibacillus polymyxa]|uniref:hypothetical protein n=1 Tax=Paenibacillus polymyxa TaxID=1406 RepID=UPI001BEC81C6|nr:hypothetical protein [Paenibacillus polymyxa]MBT2285224.1 hypothetical protein [Paenibacillus polymyxa]